jgi:hypothetical protein
MAFEIRIKPLVLFDLEDKIRLKENQAAGKGKQFYQSFLSELHKLQHRNHGAPVYEVVRKYAAKDLSCNLFYMITGDTILIMGLL